MSDEQRNLPLTRKERRSLWNHEAYLVRYPRLIAHIVAESWGHCSPILAARVLMAADRDQDDQSEWVSSSYGDNPHQAVRDSIKHRGVHWGDAMDYENALREVRAIAGHPNQQRFQFASWL